MNFIETERLKLIPLTNFYLTLWAQDRSQMELHLGLKPSAMQMASEFTGEIDDALRNFWIPRTAIHTEKYQWFTNWEIVEKSLNTSIGGMGFLGGPDDHGTCEMGYCFDSRFHGLGYGSEALAALCRWGFLNRDLRRIQVETGESNGPSRRILEKCGFALSGETRGENVIYALERISGGSKKDS